MILPFTDGLIISKTSDDELRQMADRHYSRRTIGAARFTPPGRTLMLRNTDGTIVFAWVFQQYRTDNLYGYQCTIFRNESNRRSSEIILEAEKICLSEFGTAAASMFFTFVNPNKIKSVNPGYCFKKAGYEQIERRRTTRGELVLLTKYFTSHFKGEHHENH